MRIRKFLEMFKQTNKKNPYYQELKIISDQSGIPVRKLMKMEPVDVKNINCNWNLYSKLIRISDLKLKMHFKRR